MTTPRISAVDTPHLSRELTASQPLTHRISAVGTPRISAVDTPHLSRQPRLTCGLRWGTKVGFISLGYKPYRMVIAGGDTSTDIQLVPSLRDGDEKTVSLSPSSKSKSDQGTKEALV